MIKKRILVEFGMGSSLRHNDYTRASARAVKDALWHNSINAAEVLGFNKADMLLDVTIGVQKPELVDVEFVRKIFPYGVANIKVVKGGLDICKEHVSEVTIIANAGIEVSFDMERN